MRDPRTGRTVIWLVMAIVVAAATLAAGSAARELEAEKAEFRAVEASKGLMGLGTESARRPFWMTWLMPWLPAERSVVVAAHMWGTLGEREGAILGRLTHIRRLSTDQRGGVTRQGFGHISRLAELERLGVAGTNVTDDDLASLAPLRNLKTIVLTNTGITDRGLDALLTIRSLEVISIEMTDTTAAGIVKLRALPRLQTLRLDWASKAPLSREQRESFTNASGQHVVVIAAPTPHTPPRRN